MKVSFDNVHCYEVKLKVDVDKGEEERGELKGSDL